MDILYMYKYAHIYLCMQGISISIVLISVGPASLALLKLSRTLDPQH